jgi:26S proteasome regulatory subunit N3
MGMNAKDADMADASPTNKDGSDQVKGQSTKDMAETPKSIEEKLLENVQVIDEAVRQKEPRLISSRLLRKTQALKKELTAQGIASFAMSCFSSVNDDGQQMMATDHHVERIRGVLGECASFQGVDWSLLVSTSNKNTSTAAKKDHWTELEMYVYVVSSMMLVEKREWADVSRVCQVGVDVVMEYNARIVDPMGAKLYSYMSLAAEKLGVLGQIRGTLLQLHRAAVLRHDSIGQETLLNLLLRNYLHYSLYNQAEALRAKAQPEVYRSSAQHCRLLYYHGRIQAVLLEYSDAKEALVQASRKAPQSAQGFRLQVAKWLVVVRLLLGEVPNRSELAPSDLRCMMGPYYELARAVGAGDVAVFHTVAETHQESFENDGLRHVIARLRANVIRSGVRRIATAYSRISLSDISTKLGLSSVSDAEYIVAKAIRDGGITAELDHESGIMTCSSVSDVYSTDEPLNAFHARIAFCLDVHNEAYKALRHDPQKKKWNTTESNVDQETLLQDALDAFFDD